MCSLISRNSFKITQWLNRPSIHTRQSHSRLFPFDIPWAQVCPSLLTRITRKLISLDNTTFPNTSITLACLTYSYFALVHRFYFHCCHSDRMTAMKISSFLLLWSLSVVSHLYFTLDEIICWMIEPLSHLSLHNYPTLIEVLNTFQDGIRSVQSEHIWRSGTLVSIFSSQSESRCEFPLAEVLE